MEWKTYLLLLATLCLQSCTAHPIGDQDPDSQLDALKSLLGRLEEKLSELEVPDTPEVRLDELLIPEQNGSPLAGASNAFGNPLLKGLRSIQSRKMIGGSGCFGRPIDKINSLSGMGCRGLRRN